MSEIFDAIWSGWLGELWASPTASRMGPEDVPVFKAHLTPSLIPGEGVLMFFEDRVRALHGVLYEAVVPLIDGRRSMEKIVEALEGEIEPAKVIYTLQSLEQRGYLTSRKP